MKEGRPLPGSPCLGRLSGNKLRWEQGTLFSSDSQACCPSTRGGWTAGKAGSACERQEAATLPSGRGPHLAASPSGAGPATAPWSPLRAPGRRVTVGGGVICPECGSRRTQGEEREARPAARSSSSRAACETPSPCPGVALHKPCSSALWVTG